VQITISQRRVVWNYPEIVSLFRGKGLEGVNPLLRGEEQNELFETVDLHRVAELILQGMNRF